MEEEIYRVEGVGFSYGGVLALNDISFTVRRGESLAVLGANGTGKSTLLKILNGLIFPSSGSVMFRGGVLSEGAILRSFRESVGFVFSDPDVQLFSPTVYDEVAFGPLQIGLPDDEVKKRVDDVLEMLGITRLKERAPHTLSGGEKKKAAIASVLSLNPDVLLLDEPTAALDPRTQVWLLELLGELKRIKKTFIIATHDLSFAEDISERVVVLDEAHRLSADGPAGQVLKDKALLLRANLIHEHAHKHGAVTHIHSHGPFSRHDEHD